MLATNDVGDSVLSKETEAVTTLQDGERLGTLGRKEGGRQGNLCIENIKVAACLSVFSLTLYSVFSSQCLTNLQWSSQWNQQPLPQSWCSGRYSHTVYIHTQQNSECRLIIYLESETPADLLCLYVCFVMLCGDAIIIIYWTRKGQRPAQTDWRDVEREGRTDGGTDCPGSGREMFKLLMRIYQQERC